MWAVNIANKQLPRRTVGNMRRQAPKKHLYTKSMKLIDEHFDFEALVGIKSLGTTTTTNPTK